MVKFRFHRGGLAEALLTVRDFDTCDDLVSYLVEYFTYDGQKSFDACDVVFGNKRHNDKRIGWRDTCTVSVKRFGSQVHDHCAIIGFMATQFDEVTNESGT